MRLVLIVCLLVSGLTTAQERPLPDAAAFLKEVRARLQTDDARQQGYMYLETRRDVRYDAKGRPTSEKVEVFESYPGLPGESRWERKISENGRPVPQATLDRLDHERQKKVLEFQQNRDRETAKDRDKRDRERARAKGEDAKLIEDAFNAFDIRMIGREAIGGHDTIAFTLTPRAAYKPLTADGKFFKRVKGKAWASETEYELVRVEVEVVDAISIGAGLMARVHEGTTASFERRKVNGEAWLPARLELKGSARLFLLKRLRVGTTNEFSGYRKFAVGTSETFTPPKPPSQ